MKTIYTLSISINDKPQYPRLEVCYNSQAKAMEMLSKFYADFKKAHNISDEESDDKWDISDDTYQDSRTISVCSIGKNTSRCSFFGKVRSSFLLEDDDEVKCMEHVVLSFDYNPDVLCKLVTPVVNDYSFSISDIIDVKEGRRLDMPVGKEVSVAAPETVDKYYELNKKLNFNTY